MRILGKPREFAPAGLTARRKRLAVAAKRPQMRFAATRQIAATLTLGQLTLTPKSSPQFGARVSAGRVRSRLNPPPARERTLGLRIELRTVPNYIYVWWLPYFSYILP